MRYDAVVVGAGPNGLAAAITIARTGRAVLLVEARQTVGGGARSAALTLPGFVHDVCSAIHPLAVALPFFRGLPLAQHGLEFVHPELPLAHPLDDGTAVVLERSVEATSAGLGADGEAYRKLMGPLVAGLKTLGEELLVPPRLIRHPLVLARLGLLGLRSAEALARARFRTQRARALLAGLAGHAQLPLDRAGTAAAGLVLGAAGHGVGWPAPRGGAQRLVDALASYLRSLGGEVVTGERVGTLDELPEARVVLLDVTPRQLLQIAGDRLPGGYRKRLERFRYGPGIFKVDYALAGPVPWRAPECARAGTVHLGGTLEEIAASESAVEAGQPPDRPYVLVAQHSVFDATRAPPGKHTLWAYCHVPRGSTADMRPAIEAQLERFAPGFRERILARHTHSPAELERYNENCAGGDISGGAPDGWQLLARPVLALDPYATPAEGIYLCSSSTPPGPGVHGMCGYFAARSALSYLGRHG